MSDEYRPEDEVEAHGPLGTETFSETLAEGTTAEATDDEPDVEAHGPLIPDVLSEGPRASAPVNE